jgi:alpha-L-rhamnosidase
VEFARKQAGDEFIWTGGFHFGDWLDFGSSSRGNMGATPTELLATAFFAHSTEILRDSARILGKTEDATRYDILLSNTRKAFAEKFVKEDGSVTSETQTAYALALQFDLVPEALRPKVAQKLVQDVRTRGHLTTGFLGTPHLTHALSRFGYLADAYRLLLREQFPSWLYPVKQGATTIWERWDGIKPDGSFQDAGMNSFNHYAYGAIGDWMYRVTAGLEMDATVPGYKRVLVQPQPGGGLTWVKARHASLYGDVRSAWRLRGGKFELEVEVPANARALVRLPKANRAQVTESGQALAVGNGMSAVRQEGDATAVEVGSGVYRFSYPMGK